MASNVRFLDQVPVSAYGSNSSLANTGSFMITGSDSGSKLTFTKGDGTTFDLFVTASSDVIANPGGSGTALTTISIDSAVYTISGADASITGSSLITGSVSDNTLTFTKGDGTTFALTVDTGSGGSSDGIFSSTGSYQSTTNTLVVTGSTLEPSPYNPSYPDSNLTSSQGANKYAMVVSESVYHYNSNVGVPTSKAWKTDLGGSYFDRFDHNTDTSEILRFVAGLLSSSAPDASPNTKIFNSITTNYSGQGSTSKDALFNGILGSSYESGRLSINWTSSEFIDYSKTSSYKEAQDYFLLKGFMTSGEKGSFGNDTGTNPFNGSYGTNIPTSNIISSFSGLSFTATSVAAGSTLVSSSVDTQLFGLGELNSGAAIEFAVQVIASQSFSDNSSVTTPDQSSNTFFTSSFSDFSLTSFTTANGLTLGKIIPSNASIQPAYQDGKFSSVAGTISGRYAHAGSTNSNIISSSGYYRMHGVKTGIKTGSQADYNYKNGSDSSTSVKFYMASPYNSGYLGSEGINADITLTPPPVTASNNLEDISFSATSRSLSGAPYLRDISYAYRITSEVSKSFDPAYGSTSIILENGQSGWNSMGTPNFTPTQVSVTNQGVQTTGGNSGVLSADKNTQRSTNDIPHKDDIAFLSSSFNLNSNISSNIIQGNTTPTYPTLTFTTTGKNWKGSTINPSNLTRDFFSSTRFDQPTDSGSMFIYDQDQDYDGADTLTGKTESFAGENYRVQITDNLLSASYNDVDHFNTSSYNVYNLGDLDLQVKGYPSGLSNGYLARPGGTYGYWITDPDSTKDYKFYARIFELPSGTSKRGTLSVDVGNNNLVNWNSNSSGIGLSVLYLSSIKGQQIAPAPSPLTRPLLFDFTNISSTVIENDISQDNFKNPFPSPIDLRGISGGNISGDIYTQVLLDNQSAVLDPTYNSFVVLIRYKGDIAPIRKIEVNYT